MLELFLDEVHSSFIEKINAANNVIACCEVMKETLKEYCRTKKYHSTCSNSVLVQKIQAAVDLDLTQPLTLQYFSEKLNVNSSYLSSLFRKETGETITEYVTRRRLEHASGLLLNSTYPVHAIAELTGIADVHYFSKLFKKYKGETPSQYRERKHAQ